MKELKDIEKSIIKKFRKEIYRRFIRAINDYDMIKENDVIGICISGGKDSFLLAKCMQELKRHNKVSFELKFILMDPGYDRKNIKKIKENAKKLNIDINIFKSNIFSVVDLHGNNSPCYLCARMRRGALYDYAQKQGCNKIALGHHFNDVIETILLNQLYNGQFSGMLPILDSEHFKGMQLIRPLFYVKEKDILYWVKYSELEFIDCACSVTKKNTGKRSEVKNLINQLLKDNENADINIFNSMFNVNINTTRYKKN